TRPDRRHGDPRPGRRRLRRPRRLPLRRPPGRRDDTAHTGPGPGPDAALFRGRSHRLTRARAAHTPVPQNPRSRKPPMLRTALRNVLAHKARLVMTVLAVCLGVAFVSGTLVFADSTAAAYRAAASKDFADIAVTVTPKD